jgi:hypothetical protein
MPINLQVGRFALDCLPSGDRCDDVETVYSDNPEELRTEALKILRGGRYGLLVLYRWHAIKHDWFEIEELTTDALREGSH